MKLYKTNRNILVEQNAQYYLIEDTWDDLIHTDNLRAYLEEQLASATPYPSALNPADILPPIGSQEIWGSGVTYFRSREARMEEAQDAGGGDFYDKVYAAERPEIFFKAGQDKAVGSGQQVRIRKDSHWNVPEPELTLVINAQGKIVGYTLGNDMSSRDIEGENPLYLPQAKTYDGSAAIGPCVWVPQEPLAPSTTISLEIRRAGKLLVSGETSISQMKRSFEELVGWLCMEMSFPQGVYLMTGTGIIPPTDFSLEVGDLIRISVAEIGVLENTVAS
ncbi:MAG: fumarylacetoacetate hydrolase family protein [Bacteroidota bacterium]